MGSSSRNRPLKRKKKGRPSLLDLQKRNLRLQNPNPNPNPNPSPNPNPNPSSNPPATRRSTRANPATAADDDDDDDDDDDSSTGNRREKKLKLVHRLPLRPANSASDLASSASDSGAADREEVEERNSASEAADPLREPEADQAVTPLPDRKLLEFILDRLQKKDTYSVFSEPVDPEDLPDYRDVIEHPMDFGTVRKKLLGGAYADLEQFEATCERIYFIVHGRAFDEAQNFSFLYQKDVLLISSNAMQYNAPSTIYFRQARAIQELAKKNFENLRQESDDNEPEPKTVRRGRPPIKNIIKRTVGRSAAEHTGSDFSSDASPAGDNSHLSNMAQDLSRKVSTLDRLVSVGISTRASHGLSNTEAYSWSNEHKSDRSEDYSASVMRTLTMKNGKKLFVAEEDRRSTYKLPQLSDCAVEASVLTTFDGEKKLLVPVGVHLEHAYARSLARFAAKFGTIGWEIAAKRIQRVLPRTKFGRGWVGDGEPHQKSQQPLLFTSSQHLSSEPMIPTCTTVPKTEQNSDGKEVHAANLAAEQAPDTTISPSTSPAVRDRSSNVVENNNYLRGSSHGGCNVSSDGGGSGPKVPFQIQQNPAIQRSLNGFNSGYGYNQLSQVERMVKPLRPHDSIGTDAIVMTHSRVLDMVSRNNSSVIHQSCVSQLDADKSEMAGAPSAINSSSPSADSAQDSQGQQQGLLLNPRHGAVPPDLIVGFQSSGSPISACAIKGG